MEASEKFKNLKDYLEGEIAHWKAISKQQFGSVDLNMSLTTSGIISGLEIAEDFIKTNAHTSENWNTLVSEIDTKITTTQQTQNREIDIEGKNYLGGQVQGLRKVRNQL